MRRNAISRLHGRLGNIDAAIRPEAVVNIRAYSAHVVTTDVLLDTAPAIIPVINKDVRPICSVLPNYEGTAQSARIRDRANYDELGSSLFFL